MTTITYKEGIIAADSMLSAGTTIMDSNCVKIHENKRWIIAFAGHWTSCMKVVDWILEHGLEFNELKLEERDNYWFIYSKEKKTLSFMDSELYPVKLDLSKSYAIGIGDEIALGAMLAGATAIDAVKIATMLNSYTGGNVQSVRLDGK